MTCSTMLVILQPGVDMKSVFKTHCTANHRRAFGFVGLVVGAIAVGVLMLVVWPDVTPPPPKLEFVSAESIGLRNESGLLSLVVEFNVNFPRGICVRDVGKKIEARMGNRPSNIHATMAGVSLSATQASCLLLIPEGTTTCRVSLKYARLKVTPSSRISSWVLMRLPVSIDRKSVV